MTPLVSVVVPVYNAERWLGAAIASALDQTWPEIEVVAVNDGSPDGSLSLLRKIADPRLRVLDQPNRGASGARNAGLAAARGEFIQFLDADDLLARGKVEAQVRALLARGKGFLASGHWARFVGDDPAAATPESSTLFADLSPVEYLTRNLSTGQMMHPAAWLVPADIARRAGPWNERLSLNDDGEYFARAVLASKGIFFVDGSTSLYRSGLPGSLSGKADRRALESLNTSCELIAAHLLSSEDTPQVRSVLADYFQRLAYELYPVAEDLHIAAAERARSLGGSALRPSLGRRQRMVARILGWKMAKRLALLRKR